MTKFSGTLPKGDLNGLTALSNQLLKNPKGTHIIVGVIDVKTITTDVDTADQIATVRFRRVEAIDPADADHAVRMMQRAAERRTGAAMLPMEMEDELKELMAALDLNTGELFDYDPDAAPQAANPDIDPDTELAAGDEDAVPAVPAETPAPAPDEAEAGDADREDLPAAAPEPAPEPAPAPDPEPAPDPAPEQEPPAEAPKKKRGRPTKAEAAAKKAAAEAAAAAPIEDLAAANVPKAPWDDEPLADHYPEHHESE
jgi:hypothetical protein